MEGTKFKSVSTGSYHAMAIDVDGNLWGWGKNNQGQLGDGTTNDSTTPIRIMEGTKFKDISCYAYVSGAIDLENLFPFWKEYAIMKLPESG